MSWNLLPTNYTDATWQGLKKYQQVNNPDNTVSFQDVTQYTNRDNSFFGAMDANRMNEALNTIMSMVEDGTDLYAAFQNYFNLQKSLFEDTADITQEDFNDYVDALKAEGDAEIQAIKTDYHTDMNQFKTQQQAIFNTWFEFIQGQLGEDVAGNLQNQINALDTKTDGFEPRNTVFSADGKTITETYGDKEIITTFVSDTVIIQRLYEGGVLTETKTITFLANGNIQEVVS